MKPVLHSVAVYDGMRHIGEVVVRGTGQIEALDGNGRPLGFFPDRHAAEAELWRRRLGEAPT
ncbi:MAG: hypothetical protein AB7O56_03470 [Bauldia sp.]